MFLFPWLEGIEGVNLTLPSENVSSRERERERERESEALFFCDF